MIDSLKRKKKFKKDYLAPVEITLTEEEEHFHGWATVIAFVSNNRPKNISDLVKLLQSELEQPGQLLGLNLFTDEIDVRR